MQPDRKHLNPDRSIPFSPCKSVPIFLIYAHARPLNSMQSKFCKSEAVSLLSKKYPKTGRAFRMVQGLDAMYQCNHPSEAEKVFNRLTSWLKRSRLEPMKKVADTLRKHKKAILGYFFARVTNAVAEGINSMIQSAKRRARGYRTLESYKCMIYLVAGKLSLDCPPLFA